MIIITITEAAAITIIGNKAAISARLIACLHIGHLQVRRRQTAGCSQAVSLLCRTQAADKAPSIRAQASSLPLPPFHENRNQADAGHVQQVPAPVPEKRSESSTMNRQRQQQTRVRQ